MIPDSLFPALLSQFVQVSCVAVLAAIVTRWTRGNRPHLVHAVWLIVFLKCITPPIVASPTSPFSWLQAALADSEGNRRANTFYAWTSDPENRTAQSSSLGTSLTPDSPGSGNDLGELWSLELSVVWQCVRQVASSLSAVQLLLLSWLLVAVAIFGILAFRFMTFLRRVNRTKLRGASCDQYSSRLNGLVAKIEVKLGMRQRARVEVVDALIGPAIVGLFSPTILLPKVIIDRTSDKHLEALIAHELVHFRRGDLWWSALQTLAVCCYWFHPLVWLARSVMNREAEKCCDEETIGSLKCEPGEYARCLISVLECKHLLRAAPLLPGVRPVDITAKRLERIMSLRHGCHNQCPRWVRITLIVGAIILLPGATLTFAQQKDVAAPSAKADEPTLLPLLPRAQKAATVSSVDVETETVYHHLESMDITDVLTKLQATEKVTLEQAKDKLLAQLPSPNSKAELTIEIEGAKGAVKMGGDAPSIKVAGNRLYVLGTEPERSSIRSYLEHYRYLGNKYIVYEIRIVDVPTRSFEDLTIRWNSENSNSQSADSNEPTKEAVVTASFESTNVAKSRSIVLFDQDRIRELLLSEGCNIELAPRISAFHAQLAQVHSGSEHPFIRGHQPVNDENGKPTDTLQPEIGLVHAGTKLELQGTLLANDPSKLAVRFKYSQTKVLGFETFAIEKDGQKLSIQKPRVDERVIETQVQQLLGSTFAVVGEPEQVNTITEKRVPLLDKIPYVNRLFKNVAMHSENRTKIVLVTSRLEGGTEELGTIGPRTSEAASETADTQLKDRGDYWRPIVK